MYVKDPNPPPSCGVVLLVGLLVSALFFGLIFLIASHDHSGSDRRCTGGAYEVECY